jgi:hypothetical protein
MLPKDPFGKSVYEAEVKSLGEKYCRVGWPLFCVLPAPVRAVLGDRVGCGQPRFSMFSRVGTLFAVSVSVSFNAAAFAL